MSPRIMKSLARFTAAATVLSVAALTAQTLPASASMAGVVVLYSNQINSNQGATNQDVGCQAGTYRVSQSLDGLLAVANGCGVRVWIEGGTPTWTYCVSPHQYTTVPGYAVFPAVVGVSTNTASCNAGSMATEVMLYGSSGDQAIGCIAGDHGVETANLFETTAVANGCGVRVWLEGGSPTWTYCVSPHQYTTLPAWADAPTVAGVSTNTAAC